MGANYNLKAIFERAGGPQAVADEMDAFHRNMRDMESVRTELVEYYPNEWVAYHEGQVQAHGQSINAVLEQVDALGWPRTVVAIGFMDADPTSMIL